MYQGVPLAISGSVTALRFLIGTACALLPLASAHADGSSTTPPAGSPPVNSGPQGQQQPPEEVEQDVGQEAAEVNKSVVSKQELENERPQTAFEALKNVPGVVNSDTKGGVSDDFYIRGIHLSETTSYRLNGSFPIENNIGLMDDKERVEALKGVGALLYGVAPPAGIINLVTKRATPRPIAAITVSSTQYSFDRFGQLGALADVGSKFGSHDQFGVRANVSATHLNKGIIGATGQRYFASVASDWQVSKKLSLHLDVEAYYMDVVEQAIVRQLAPDRRTGMIPLPRVPDPTLLLSGPWAVYKTDGVNILGNLQYQIAEGWNFITEAGISHARRPQRFITRMTAYDINTGQGLETISLSNDQHYDNSYFKAELKQRTAITQFLTSYLSVGANFSERYFNNPTVTVVQPVPQNLYTPVALPAPPPANPTTNQPQDSYDWGFYAYDTLSFWERVHLLGGVRYTIYHADNVVPSGDHEVSTYHVWSPAIGTLVVLVPGLGAYASYMKGLEETGQAPIGSANQFQVLPPAIAKQTEVGLRLEKMGGVSATLGYFDINRANAVIDPVTNIYAINGTIHYQGVESTLSVELFRRLLIQAGGQWIHAEQHAPSSINGLRPENTPEWAGNSTVTYRFGWFLEGFRLSAGALYTGAREINPQNQGTIPAVTIFSAGAGYTTTVGRHLLAFNLNITNLGNRRYWSSASNNNLGVGQVRAFRFNAKFEY